MMDQLTTILDEDGEQALFQQVLKGFEYHIVGESPVEYKCYCSRERVSDALRCVDKKEIDDIVAEGKNITVSCQFCDKVYTFTPEELQTLSLEKTED
jgi:molecular chaperone Hsp33